MNRIARNLLLSAVAVAATSAFAQNQPIIGLITKTETNPFFVKMKEGAEAEAKKLGAKLLTAAGKQDGDTAAQIAALENMTTAGAKTILITSSGDAIIPTIKKGHAKGGQLIACDAVNMIKDYVQARKLVEESAVIAPDDLADASRPLKELDRL